jgi:hypothetical protein
VETNDDKINQKTVFFKPEYTEAYLRDDDSKENFEELSTGETEVVFWNKCIYYDLYLKSKNDQIIRVDNLFQINDKRNLFFYPSLENRKPLKIYNTFGIYTEKKDDYHYFSFSVESNLHLFKYTREVETYGYHQLLKIKKYFIPGLIDSQDGIFEIFVIGRTCIHRFFRPKN